MAYGMSGFSGGGGIGSLLGGLLGGPGGAAALSFLPSLLGKLGLFGADPQQQLRKQLLALQSQQNINKLTNSAYQSNISSPAFSQAQGSIAAGANATAGNLARQAGALGPGGTSALLSSITPSIVGSQQAGLRTSAYQSAQEQAQNQIRAQIQALMGTSGPSQNMNLFGAGLSQFGNYLMPLLLKNQGLVPTGYQRTD